MPLFELFARKAVQDNEEQLMALPESQRKDVVLSIIKKTRDNPIFSVDESAISPETAGYLSKLQKAGEGRYQEKGVTAMSESERRKLTRRAELESQRVEMDEDLPAGTWKLGYGVDPLNDLTNVLTDHYKQPVQVVKDQDDFIYLNPETGKLTRANLPLTASAGHAIPMAMDVAGTVIGGTPKGWIGKAILKETLGSGTFTAAGEYGRLKIGQMTGVHDLTDEEMRERALKVGAEAAAFTGGIGTGVASIKGANNFIKGGVFTKEEATKWGLNAEEADELLEQINKINKMGGSDKEVKGTLFQKTDSVDVGTRQAELQRNPAYAQRFEDRARADQEGATEALETISRPPHTVDKGLPDVQSVAEKRIAGRVEQGEKIVAKNREELQSQLDEIGKASQADAGAGVSDYIKLKRQTADDAVTRAWGDDKAYEATGFYPEGSVKQVGGYDPVKKTYGIDIPYGASTKRLKKIYKRQAGTAQYQGAARGARGAYVEPKVPKKGEAKPEVLQDKQDLADLNKEISALRSDITLAKQGRGKTPTQLADLVEMKDALVEDRALGLIKAGREDVLKTIEAAEQMTREFNDTYVRSAVGDLMETTERGIPKIKSPEFVRNILKRETGEVEDFVGVMGDDMELWLKWKEGVATEWKEKAFKGGKFNREASDKWFNDHAPALGEFFTDAEIKAYKESGKFAEKVADQADRLEKFKTKANKWGSGSLATADPDGLVSFVTGKSGSWNKPYSVAGKPVKTSDTINKIKYVKNVTANHPAAWKRFQMDYKKHIHNDILEKQSKGEKFRRINPTKLANYVSDTNNANIIKEVLGNKYYRDLNTINKTIQMINKSPKRLGTDEDRTIIVQMIRAAGAPPLTRRGRAFTAALTWDTKRSHQHIADAILDERTMRKVANLAEHQAHTRQFFEKAFSLGFALPDEEEQ